jgi:lipopolysaccharide transport system ATP-binding protein
VSIIRLAGVSKTYGLYRHGFDRVLEAITGKLRHRQVHALHPLDLSVAPGEIVGLIGKNGAGKSTLLKVVSGMIPPTTGTLEVHGKVAALLELGAGFHPDLTGRENLFLVGAAMGLDRAFLEQRFDDIVGFSEIRDFVDMPVKTYSSGMFVRLAFALATCVKPDILIIDEALSVGDGAFARKSFNRIMEFRDAGVTILFCSHSLYQVEALCSRAVWLKGGRLHMDGEPHRVVARYNAWLNAPKGQEPDAADAELAEPAQEAVPGVRAGAGVAQFRKLEVLAGGQPLDQAKIRSRATDLTVDAVIASDPQLPAPTFGVVFRDLEGRPIASAGSKNDGVILKRDGDGITRVRLSFPELPLLKGSYYLDAYVLCEKALHVYDAVKGAIRLEVEQEGLEQGVVALARHWAPLGPHRPDARF